MSKASWAIDTSLGHFVPSARATVLTGIIESAKTNTRRDVQHFRRQHVLFERDDDEPIGRLHHRFERAPGS